LLLHLLFLLLLILLVKVLDQKLIQVALVGAGPLLVLAKAGLDLRIGVLTSSICNDLLPHQLVLMLELL